MANVQLNWTVSQPGSRQRPVAHTRIEARVSDSLPWDEIAVVPAPGNERLVEDLPPGQWQFRAVEVDDLGVEAREEHRPVAVVDIAFDPPSGTTNFTATLV